MALNMKPGCCCSTPTPTTTCGPYSPPLTLHLTDAVGTITLGYAGVAGTLLHWTACRVISLAGSCTLNNFITCSTHAEATNPVMICYDMYCDPSSPPHFIMSRSWTWVISSFTGNHAYYSADTGSGVTCASPGSNCLNGPPASCPNPNSETSSDNEDPTSTSPFAITFFMVDNSLTIPDPIGGNVTVSA